MSKRILIYALPLLTGLFLIGGLARWYFNPHLEEVEESLVEEVGSGEVFGTSTHLPAQAGVNRPKSLPEEIPIYSPATLLGTTETKQVAQVVLETSSTESEIISFYAHHMRTAHWQREGRGVYSKGDQRLELELIPDMLKPLTTIILTYSR